MLGMLRGKRILHICADYADYSDYVERYKDLAHTRLLIADC